MHCRFVRRFRDGLLALVLAGLWTCPGTAQADSPSATNGLAGLNQRAYVWQRVWTSDFRSSLTEIAPDFAALDVLVAEISWRDSVAVVTRIAPNWPALQAADRPVGLVVRIGPTSHTWEPASAASHTVVETCRAALAEARRHGIEPAELQLDFDAATARLAAYRTLVQTVRREVAPPRLILTALPDWMRSAAFPALATAADGYVLQVHSLEKPRRIGDAYSLCDLDRARRWVAQAAALGRPFRIALPTYGYRLVFNEAGDFAALEAEGVAQSWPAGHQTRTVMADSAALAGYVEELLASPPAGCEGLVWFRFPMTHDELAWRWPTLHSVMQGRRPEARAVLTTRPAAGGALDIMLNNTGTADAELSDFDVEWSDALLLAADPLGGWRFERAGPNRLVVHPPPHDSNGRLRPGDTRHVGWLRLDRAVAITARATP